MASETDELVGTLETDRVLVRTVRADDLSALVAIDEAAIGRRRPRFFELMLERAVTRAAFQVSLAAELEGVVVGFLFATLYYGEYGLLEPSASIDVLGVHPDKRKQSVGRALMRQLRMNLGALGVASIRTEVAWHDSSLLGFFRSQGFRPAERSCLECTLDPTAVNGG